VVTGGVVVEPELHPADKTTNVIDAANIKLCMMISLSNHVWQACKTATSANPENLDVNYVF
jgi:hypothetical protein